MSAYDQAHELAREIVVSDEYRDYLSAKEKLWKEPNSVEMLEDFRRRQWELQMAAIGGREVDEEKANQLENIYQLISLNPRINEFLTAEYRFSRLMTDIQKIIVDAIDEWFDDQDKKHLN